MKERLQKIIAASGLTSRRKAEKLILEGRVTLNGRTVRELGTRADAGRDHVKVDGKALRRPSLLYYAVHKPRGVLSTAFDENDRPIVTDLVASSRRLYPAGRLDFQSEGLIILTNDGVLTRRVTAGGEVEKVYRVKVRGYPAQADLDKLRRGVKLEGRRLAPCFIKLIKKSGNSWFQVILKEGKNRQIRRMFESIGHPVMRLRRVGVGPVLLGELPPGAYRKLTAEEVRELRGDGPARRTRS